MATTRRGQPDLHVRLPSTSSGSQVATASDLPPISALFLIEFDVKAGYTISWKEHKPGVELESVVEYKSLPSGLHTVSDDLIYFVHEGHAGLSAFINAPVDDTETRNARMLAVGVLVPLSYGRLGRAWKHAENLKELASQSAVNAKETSSLSQYWEKHHAREPEISQPERPQPKPTTETPIVSFQAPPKPRGHVYNISILSNIPLSTFEILPANKSAPHRLRPLFTVGVHDIPFLVAGAKFSPSALEDHGAGWVACTTDSILATKDTLCDVLITMPPAHADQAREHIWPTVECPRGAPVKATQRDLRRYRSLRAGLSRLRHQHQQPRRAPTTPSTTMTTNVPPSPTTADAAGNHDSNSNNTVLLTEDDERALVEPQTWAALAYSGFMWWASAGEQARSDEAEESAHDAALLAGLSSPTSSSSAAVAYSATTPTFNMNMNMSTAAARRPSVDLSTSTGSLAAAAAVRRRQRVSQNGGDGDIEEQGGGDGEGEEEEEEARVELATIAYFHRLTTQILTTLAEVVLDGGGSSSGSDDEDDDDDPDFGVDDGGGREGEEENQALLGRVSEEGEEAGRDDDEFVNARRRGAGGGRSRSSGRSVGIGSQAMGAMGLDVWSAADAAFVIAAVERYFGRRAHVEGKVVEVCGVRVC